MGYKGVAGACWPLVGVLVQPISWSAQVSSYCGGSRRRSWRTMMRLRTRGHTLRWRQDKRACVICRLRGDRGTVWMLRLLRVAIRIESWSRQLHGVEGTISCMIQLIQLFQMLLKNSKVLPLQLLFWSLAFCYLISANLGYRFQLYLVFRMFYLLQMWWRFPIISSHRLREDLIWNFSTSCHRSWWLQKSSFLLGGCNGRGQF